MLFMTLAHKDGRGASGRDTPTNSGDRETGPPRAAGALELSSRGGAAGPAPCGMWLRRTQREGWGDGRGGAAGG